MTRRGSGLAAWITAGLAIVGGFPAASSDVAGPILERCKVRMAVVLGVDEAVRSRVPEPYELMRDPSTNRPLVYVSGDRCEAFTVGDHTTVTTVSTVAPIIASPDGSGCVSPLPVVGALRGDALPLCNFYMLWDITDNATYAAFLRDGMPDYPIWVDESLSFEEGDFDPSLLGARFTFRMDGSSPFNLSSDYVVRERPGGGPLASSYWAETSAGTVKLTFTLEDAAFGEAAGTVRTQAGSELAEIFGGEIAEVMHGSSLMTAIRWTRGVATKTIIP